MKQLNSKLILLVLVTLFLAACGGQATGVVATLPAAVETAVPPQAVLNAQTWLAEQLDVAAGQVTVVEMAQTDWPDSCLGLGRADESCAQAVTPGWRVLLSVNGQNYEVRTDESGSAIRLGISNAG
jgi:hypothetical protein